MTEAYFVDPVCFKFKNPADNVVKCLFIQVDHGLSFYERIELIQNLGLKRLAPEINGIHEQLMMNDLANKGFFHASAGEVDPKWIEPHLVKCLPTRQGNGVVWEGEHPPSTHPYWKEAPVRHVTETFADQRSDNG